MSQSSTWRIRIVAGLGLLLTTLNPAGAQQVHSFAPGAVVRWKDTQSGKWIEGNVTAVANDSIAVESRATRRVYWIAPATTRYVEIRGDRGAHGRSVWLGFFIGAGAGAAFGALSGSDCTGFCVGHISRTALAAGSALVFGLVGSVIGGMVAPDWHWTRSSEWTRARDLAGAKTAVIEPLVTWKRGPALGVQLRF